MTQGDTFEEAIATAKEAIGLYIETLEAHSKPIPEEQEHPQAITITVAA